MRGSGIGRATALAFGEAGYRVTLAGRRREILEETTRLVDPSGERALVVRTGISHADDVHVMTSETLRVFGRLDVAANCAALEPQDSILEIGVEDFDRAIAINLSGAWLCVRHEALAIIKSDRVADGPSDYAASKSGVEGLTRATAGELAPQGIRVNALRAGMFDTRMLHSAWNTGDDPDTVLAPAVASTVLGRIGHPTKPPQPSYGCVPPARPISPERVSRSTAASTHDGDATGVASAIAHISGSGKSRVVGIAWRIATQNSAPRRGSVANCRGCSPRIT